MIKQDDSCRKIFNELKNRGYISAHCKLKQSEKIPNFAPRPFSIQYHPDMNDLEENSIRFCLLHEEGHRRKFYQLGFLVVFMVLLYYYNFILGILAFFIFIVSMRSLLWGYEYNSDKYASIILRDEYNISEPSKILENS